MNFIRIKINFFFFWFFRREKIKKDIESLIQKTMANFVEPEDISVIGLGHLNDIQYMVEINLKKIILKAPVPDYYSSRLKNQLPERFYCILGGIK